MTYVIAGLILAISYLAPFYLCLISLANEESDKSKYLSAFTSMLAGAVLTASLSILFYYLF